MLPVLHQGSGKSLESPRKAISQLTLYDTQTVMPLSLSVFDRAHSGIAFNIDLGPFRQPQQVVPRRALSLETRNTEPAGGPVVLGTLRRADDILDVLLAVGGFGVFGLGAQVADKSEACDARGGRAGEGATQEGSSGARCWSEGGEDRHRDGPGVRQTLLTKQGRVLWGLKRLVDTSTRYAVERYSVASLANGSFGKGGASARAAKVIPPEHLR